MERTFGPTVQNKAKKLQHGKSFVLQDSCSQFPFWGNLYSPAVYFTEVGLVKTASIARRKRDIPECSKGESDKKRRK
jgi:hypothetical protein